MGLFGNKKDHTELALEEARRFDAADAKRSGPASRTKAGDTSVTTTVTMSGDADPAIAALFEKVFGGASDDASGVAPDAAVTVTTVHHSGKDDAALREAIAALGLEQGALATASTKAKGKQAPDDGFSAALDAIERDYKGKPVADAKAAIKAALAEHHRTVPDQVIDIMAKAVSGGGSIDVTFGP
jgi:hypothetical protein